MTSAVNTYIATEADYDSILALTNDAFMADAFFKKEEYHLRFDRPTVAHMIAAKNSRFIIATQVMEGVETQCGSIFLHWEVLSTDLETKVGSTTFVKSKIVRNVMH